jgi:hypothetical protein
MQFQPRPACPRARLVFWQNLPHRCPVFWPGLDLENPFDSSFRFGQNLIFVQIVEGKLAPEHPAFRNNSRWRFRKCTSISSLTTGRYTRRWAGHRA